jgi:hypothetical protein
MCLEYQDTSSAKVRLTSDRVTLYRPLLKQSMGRMRCIAVVVLFDYTTVQYTTRSLLNPTTTAQLAWPACSIRMHNQLHMQSRHACRLPIAAPRPRPCVLVTSAIATNQSSTEKLIEGFWEVLLVIDVVVLCCPRPGVHTHSLPCRPEAYSTAASAGSWWR